MDNEAKELANAVNGLTNWFQSQGIDEWDAVLVMGVKLASIMVLGGDGLEDARVFSEDLRLSVKKAIDTGRWT